MGGSGWGDWSDVPSQQWNDSGSSEGALTNLYSSTAVKVYSPTFQEDSEEWLYRCGVCCTASVRAKPGQEIDDTSASYTGCGFNIISIENTLNPEKCYLDIDPYRDCRIGQIPQPDPPADYSWVRNPLVELSGIAIGLIGGYVGFTWSVASFIANLVSEYDSEDFDRNRIKCKFDHRNPDNIAPSDCGCWYYFNIYAKPYSNINLKVNNLFINVERAWDGFSIEHNHEFVISSPAPQPHLMTEEERVKGDIVEIPVDKIGSYSDTLGLSSQMVAELVKKGDPIYTTQAQGSVREYPPEVKTQDNVVTFRYKPAPLGY